MSNAYKQFSSVGLILAISAGLVGVLALRSNLEWQWKVGFFVVSFVLLFFIYCFESWLRYVEDKNHLEGLFK